MLLKADEQEERIILIKKFVNTKVISFLILSLVLSMAFVTPSVYAIEVDEVISGDIEFLRSDGTNVYSVSEKEELTVKCDVTNNSLEKGINLYVASYTKNGELAQMLDVTAECKKFGKNENSILSDTFTVPENIDENYHIKAFVNSFGKFLVNIYDTAMPNNEKYSYFSVLYSSIFTEFIIISSFGIL